MALSDALHKELKNSALRSECTVSKIANLHLSKEDKEVYLKVLNNINPRSPEFISSEKLASVMVSEGYEGVSASSVARHRKQACPCYKNRGNK